MYTQPTKFDGPNFVNPLHTSHSLDNGKNYQHPILNITPSVNPDKKAEENKKRKARGGNIIYYVRLG
jgi:hypothetical protein